MGIEYSNKIKGTVNLNHKNSNDRDGSFDEMFKFEKVL